jgi:hypothetical protein
VNIPRIIIKYKIAEKKKEIINVIAGKQILLNFEVLELLFIILVKGIKQKPDKPNKIA